MKLLISIFKRILLILTRSDIIARFLFDLRLIISKVKKDRILILATITKTGTHYIRFLLAYYLEMKSLKTKKLNYKIDYDDFIVDRFFPNSWHTSYTFITNLSESSRKLNLIGLDDFPRSHMSFKYCSWSNLKVLHTYRDLREQSYVSWVMKYQCDRKLRYLYDNYDKLFQDTFGENSSQYSSFAIRQFTNSNNLRISFSQIFKYPAETLALIIQWLGEEPDLELCSLAAQLCQSTPSILVGGGEKWHRIEREGIDYKYLNQFINENKDTGAIGILKSKNYNDILRD